MYFDSVNEFLAMGGHGLYVWMSYGIFVVVILWNLFTLRVNRKQSLMRAKKTWQRERSPDVDDRATDKGLAEKQNSVEEY